MRKITARITMSVNVTDEEYKRFIEVSGGDDIDVNGDLLQLYRGLGLTILIKKGGKT